MLIVKVKKFGVDWYIPYEMAADSAMGGSCEPPPPSINRVKAWSTARDFTVSNRMIVSSLFSHYHCRKIKKWPTLVDGSLNRKVKNCETFSL